MSPHFPLGVIHDLDSDERLEYVRDLNWSSEMGHQALWGIPPPALVERTHWSLATLRVSNEMRGMQALKVAKTARD